MTLFDRIIANRGFDPDALDDFLNPNYDLIYDPFLLPDMNKAIKRLLIAHKKQEKILIYGDYDIDGLSATALLYDALKQFGFKNLDLFIPNRFREGFGLSIGAIDKISEKEVDLIVTVDCGSASKKEITHANELGIDVVVTDHHEVLDVQPDAIAVVNPKRKDSKYPFKDLAGVGVAFKLVQALQTKLKGLEAGREKWLLDLVALGTVCDVVKLVGENRINVYWGIKVLSKTRRPGLQALMAVAEVEPEKITSRTIGFVLGPRLNAAGRLETAQHSLDLLITEDKVQALELAKYLDDLNKARRIEQKNIFDEASRQAERYQNDDVLVVSGKDWNHGIVGIVAAKLLEKYKKATFVLQESGEESKGSARSYGDFNLAEAINANKSMIIKGGGHSLAAGISLKTDKIDDFRRAMNDHYKSIGLSMSEQKLKLLPVADTDAKLGEVTEEVVNLISQMEPFGFGNERPILKTTKLIVVDRRAMGSESQHLRLDLKNEDGITMKFVAFNAPENFFVEIGSEVSIWYQPEINQWNGNCTVEGYILYIDSASV